MTLSDFIKLVDSMVVSPQCTESGARDLLRSLRTAEPGDVLSVSARIFHEVLTLYPEAQGWPLFTGPSKDPSVFKTAVVHALEDPGLDALLDLDDETALSAHNIARFLSGLTQIASLPPQFPEQRRSGSGVLDLRHLSNAVA